MCSAKFISCCKELQKSMPFAAHMALVIKVRYKCAHARFFVTILERVSYFENAVCSI